jgi:hypothetical protein
MAVINPIFVIGSALFLLFAKLSKIALRVSAVYTLAR